MRKLHVGCGMKFIEGFEHLDKYIDASFIDYKCDIKDIPVDDDTYDIIYARHWLEHLYYYDAVKVLTVLKNKLTIDGHLHLILPDLSYHAKQIFLDGNSKYTPSTSNFNHAIAGFYGWVIEGKEYMQHKHGYTKKSLEELLNKLELTVTWINCRECDL